MNKFILFKMLGLNQLLTLFLLGVTSSVSNACELTPLQAKTLNNSEPNIPVSLQSHAFPPSEGGKNELDTITFDSSIKTVQSLNLSFSSIDWSTEAPSSLPRGEAQSAVVDGRLYMLGGYLSNPFQVLNTVDVYDSVNNTWARTTNMPKALTHSGTTVDGKDIYLAGGYVGKPTGGQIFATTDVWRYNVDTQTWTSMPPLPQARGGGALELLGRELHFFGGSDIKRADKGDHWFLSLDGGTKWTPAATLPNPRNHLGDAVVDGKLYAIGGQRGQDRYSVTQSSVHVWAPATNTWTAVASLPRARSHISGATFVMDDRIIVAGGEISHGRDISNVTAYDPLSDSWKELTPLPTRRRSGIAGNIENQIVYTTGYNTTTFKGVPILIFPPIISDSAIVPNQQKTPARSLTN